MEPENTNGQRKKTHEKVDQDRNKQPTDKLQRKYVAGVDPRSRPNRDKQSDTRNYPKGKTLNKEKYGRREMNSKKVESKRKEQCLTLKAINFDGTEDEFRNMIMTIVGKSLTIKDVTVNGKDVKCTAEFSSVRQVKDTTHSLQMNNKTSKVKILLQREELKRQQPIKEKVSSYSEKITIEATEVLSRHHENMDKIKERLAQIICKKKEFMSIEEYTRRHEEVSALQFKVQEMSKQTNEFESFLKSTIKRLEDVGLSRKVDIALNNLYSAFKAECKRLELALPMYANRTEIISMVSENKVSVLLGETGSGKSTQVAQYLYQTGLANKGLIVCTQPRKIAAISLATHVAQEMGSSVGHLVGYKVGMQMKMSHTTKIVYMTDHMLLNECLKDKKFSAYSCIIIDEAHERSIYTDLLLGMVKKCINNRADLKVVVTSATIDPAVFVEYFGGFCPVLSVAGRTFPVDVVWPDDNFVCDNYEQMAIDKTLEIHQQEDDGDILTFLTSPLEVDRCCNAFKETLYGESNFICLPLHGRLQPNEQQKVFEPSQKGKRKIVFATNSAETSITIPGIKYVIDTGVAKEMQFDPKKNISTLCVTTVTKSSANQRKGRAGRTQAGKCFRLYTEETYENLANNSVPEIMRVNLGHALLKLMELGIDPLDFDFVQAPSRDLMNAAMDDLQSVGAVINKKITDRGKWIARLPLDPKFGSFVYNAIKDEIGIEAIILSACCAAGGSMFYRSGTDKEKSVADILKVRFCHEGGDLMTMLNVYREWHIQPEKLKGTWCADNSINGKAIRGVRETVNEVMNVLFKEWGLRLKFEFKDPIEVDKVLQKLLFQTFKRNICHYLGHDKAGYLVVQKNQQVQLFPASGLKSLGLQPDWIVIEQVLKTSRDYAINVTTVLNEWITEASNQGWLHVDLEQVAKQKVELIDTFEIGEQVYRLFVGPRHSDLRSLEERMISRNPDKIIIVDASKQLGEISLYAQPDCEHCLPDMLKDGINTLKHKMKTEKSEQFLSSSNSGVRAVIGAGAQICDVLMPNEYKTIYVTGNPKIIDSKTEDDIIKVFKGFGKIAQIEKFRHSKNKNNWGKISFERKEDAELAVHKMSDNLEIGARPSIGTRNSGICSFRTKMEWCRRPSRGFGFVRFSNLSHAVHSRVMPINVGGTVVRVKPSKSDPLEVHVGNLNQQVNEDVLHDGFETALGLAHEDIERTSVIREKVNTNNEIIHMFRQRIHKKIEEYVTDGTFELDLRSPKDADFNYLAFISFSKPEEGISACMNIDHTFVLNGEMVTMKADMKSSIMVPKPVYDKYKNTVDQLVNRLSKSERADIRKKELKNKSFIVDIHTDSVETMVKIKTEILQEIKGRTLDMESNNDIHRLFTWDGRSLMKTVMEKTDTTIVSDERVLTVTVHGLVRNTEKAVEMLVEYLNQLKIGKSRHFSLKGPDKPPGIMKELMLRYEYDFNQLKKETTVNCIELDHRLHIITIIGDEQSLEKCASLIEDVIESVIKKRETFTKQTAQSRDCVVCFCPIDEGEIYRLEVCGHAHCKDCVELQYTSAVRSNSLPISCSKEGCDEFWAWKDVTKMCLKTGIPNAILVRKAVSLFVSENKKMYRYCPTADCPLIYRVAEKETLFSCPECEIRICTACHNQFHDGLTCKMAESMKKDDGGLLYWMKQNSNVAKFCPKCKTPIEKRDGCNHMTCLACKAHICWVCLAYFSSGSDCYGHLSSAHSSFV